MKVDELLAHAFVERHPDRAAGILEALDPTECAGAIADLPPELAAGVISHSTVDFAARCLDVMASDRAAEILGRVDLDMAARMLRTLPAEERSGIVAALAEETRTAVERLLRFPEGTVGSVMEPRILALSDDIAVRDAVKRLERDAQGLHSYVYIVDRGGALVGVVAIHELMAADGDARLGSVMRPAEASVSSSAAIAELLVHPGWQDFHALPVVDEERVLLGAVRYSTYRRLEREFAGRGRTHELVVTGVALAELYWVILVRALAGTAVGPSEPKAEGGSS